MINNLKTFFLLVLLSSIFLLIGHAVGGQQGLFTALILSCVMNIGAYWFSDKMVLAMHRATPIDANHPSGVYQMIEELCVKANLPMPKVYTIPEWTPNAFATGRNPQHSAVAVTEGILKILDKRELRGVLAHEISHIQNRDILISTIAACFASAIMYLVHMMRWVSIGGRRDGEGRSVNPVFLLVMMILAPLAATLIRAAISRAREYMADESGAHVSEDPDALASALEKISNPALVNSMRSREDVEDLQPAVAHLYIVNQFQSENIFQLFSTHPPVKERVARLRSMKKNQ